MNHIQPKDLEKGKLYLYYPSESRCVPVIILTVNKQQYIQPTPFFWYSITMLIGKQRYILEVREDFTGFKKFPNDD